MENLNRLNLHTDFNNAYIISDYPWGYKLKTDRKVWIEYKKNKGYRSCYSTKNPKTGDYCNAKKSVYYDFVMLVIDQDNKNHVSFKSYNCSTVENHNKFINDYGSLLFDGEKNSLNLIVKINNKINDIVKDSFKKSKELHDKIQADGYTSDKLDRNTLLTENEIDKCIDKFELLQVEFSFFGLKKRCRKKKHIRHKLGFIIKDQKIHFNNLSFMLLSDIKRACKEYKSIDSSICLEFRYCTKNSAIDSPYFKSMKYDLFDKRNFKTNIHYSMILKVDDDGEKNE